MWLIHAIGLVIDGNGQGQRGTAGGQDLGQSDLAEVAEKKVRGRGPSIDKNPVGRIRGAEEAVELPCFG